MAGRLGGDEDEIIADINVTPLVDIMLVLLIIFMVTATYIINPSIKVNLPKAASGDQTENSMLAIVMDKDQQLFLNGKPTNEAQLVAAVQNARQSKAEVHAIISADQAVSHGAVIRLIDLIKLNGVSHFAININPALRTGEPPTPTGGP